MADPTHLLTERFSAAIAAALGPDLAGVDPVIRPSANPAFGDYQVNAAMAVAKRLGSKPRDVAGALVAAVALDDVAGPLEVAGPGFVNIRLRDEWLSAQTTALLGDDRLGVTEDAHHDVVVIDYSAPNVAKEMHVGHLRTTIIGDALSRIFTFLGHEVIAQNHIGDWGTPFGMLIEHLLDVGEAAAAAELSVGDMTAFYRAARVQFDGEEGFADRARQRVVLLQSGDAQTLRLWHLLVDESKRYFNRVYDRLGVLLTDDDLAGESIYNDMLGPVVDEMEERGLAVMSDGALCLFPPGFLGRDGTPLPLMLRKRDGGFGYDATDLAAVKYRTQDLKGTYLVYVIDAGQSQHMDMVHAAGAMAGWLDDDHRAVHVGFGVVLGPDGKRLKTREGETPKLIDLLDEAVRRAGEIVAERSAHLPADEQVAVAEAVGIGGIKYADLSNDRVKDYVFDYDRMLATDGNTAAYLQYAAARCRSILRKAAEAGLAAGDSVTVAAPTERALALALLRLDGAVHGAADGLAPHRLAGHLFDLAQDFTSFYDACPVLKAATAEQRSSRLALCHLTAAAITLGLGLLGIATPERM